jgi:hypothetical protein
MEHGRQLVRAVRAAVEDLPIQVDQDGHDLRVELDAGELLQLTHCDLVAERLLAVRAGRGHGLVRVGDGQDAGAQRDVQRLDPVGVAGAVEPLVVRADERRLLGELLRRRHDLRPDARVLVHEHALLAVQRAFLEEDVVADADLPHVVEQPRPLDALDLRLRQPHHAAHLLGDMADPARMAPGVLVAGVHRVGQGADGLLEELPRLDVAVIGEPRGEERDDEERGGPPAHVVRQREDLCHEPTERRETNEVHGDGAEVLSPHGTYGNASPAADREDGESDVDGVENGGGKDEAAECNQFRRGRSACEGVDSFEDSAAEND